MSLLIATLLPRDLITLEFFHTLINIWRFWVLYINCFLSQTMSSVNMCMWYAHANIRTLAMYLMTSFCKHTIFSTHTYTHTLCTVMYMSSHHHTPPSPHMRGFPRVLPLVSYGVKGSCTLHQEMHPLYYKYILTSVYIHACTYIHACIYACLLNDLM